MSGLKYLLDMNIIIGLLKQNPAVIEAHNSARKRINIKDEL